jgi:hypothetical protein
MFERTAASKPSRCLVPVSAGDRRGVTVLPRRQSLPLRDDGVLRVLGAGDTGLEDAEAVSSDPAANSVPDVTARAECVRPARSNPAPAAVHALAARMNVPGRPSWNGSLTMPWSFSTLCIAANSTAAPGTAIFRAGPASSTGASAIVTAPPAAIAEPTNANGGRCGQARYSWPASWLE